MHEKTHPMKVPFSYQTLLRSYPNRESAIAFYKKQHTTFCPNCNEVLHNPLRKTDPLLLRCPDCGRTASIFTGTIFQGTRADIRYWLYTGSLFYYSKQHLQQIPDRRLLSIQSIKRAIGATSDQTISRIYKTLKKLFESTDIDDMQFCELIFKPFLEKLCPRGLLLTHTGEIR